MAIDFTQAIQHIGQIDGKIQQRRVPEGNAGEVAESLGNLIGQAVEKLDQSQKSTDASIVRLVAGEPVDLHHVMLQMEESMVNLNLALQVRNKVIEAYQEVQRIQL